MSLSVEMRAHRLATLLTERISKGKALGTPSYYNIIREGLVEAFLAEDEASD